jgi:hypothetical protein
MARRARNLAGGRWPGCGVRMIDLSLHVSAAWTSCLRFHPLLPFCAADFGAHIEHFAVNSPNR